METAQVSGNMMSIGDAFITAALGYAIVFVGMLLLIGIIVLVSRFMRTRQAAPTPEAAPLPVRPAEPAPGTAGEIKLNNVSERDAAMIMAIVAHDLNKPLNELRFLSIRQLEDEE